MGKECGCSLVLTVLILYMAFVLFLQTSCTFTTKELYKLYKGSVQTVQRLCTKSTKALYGLVLVADELL